MIPTVAIDEDKQVLIVTVPYNPTFIQDLRNRGLRGTFNRDKKYYEFQLGLLPEVITCLSHNFPKVLQSQSVALSSLLSHLDAEDLLSVYKTLAKKYKSETLMRSLLDKTFGAYVHIQKEIESNRPVRRIELDEEYSKVEEPIGDPSSEFAETVRNLAERLEDVRTLTPVRRQPRVPSPSVAPPNLLDEDDDEPAPSLIRRRRWFGDDRRRR